MNGRYKLHTEVFGFGDAQIKNCLIILINLHISS